MLLNGVSDHGWPSNIRTPKQIHVRYVSQENYKYKPSAVFMLIFEEIQQIICEYFWK